MKTLAILYLLPSLILAPSITACCQEKTASKVFLERSIDWSEGSIMLNDGNELKGVIKYNDNTGVLNYENGNVSRSLTSKSVAGFEFFDEGQNRQRIFYSLLFDDPATNVKKHSFFEVLIEFKTFAVLSKRDGKCRT